MADGRREQKEERLLVSDREGAQREKSGKGKQKGESDERKSQALLREKVNRKGVNS